MRKIMPYIAGISVLLGSLGCATGSKPSPNVSHIKGSGLDQNGYYTEKAIYDSSGKHLVREEKFLHTINHGRPNEYVTIVDYKSEKYFGVRIFSDIIGPEGPLDEKVDIISLGKYELRNIPVNSAVYNGADREMFRKADKEFARVKKELAGK